jgi:hypothetical protein
MARLSTHALQNQASGFIRRPRLIDYWRCEKRACVSRMMVRYALRAVVEPPRLYLARRSHAGGALELHDRVLFAQSEVDGAAML